MSDKTTSKTKAPWDRADPHPEKSVKPDAHQARIQKQLDDQLKGTFPASDALSLTGGTESIGKPSKSEKRPA